MKTKGLSLQKKFILISSLAIVALATGLGLLAADRNKKTLYAATIKQGEIMARTVSALIINELIYEKLGLVEEGGLIDNYLQELYQRQDIDLEYVAVLDQDRRVISHNDFRQYGRIFPLTDIIARGMNADGVVSLRVKEKGHDFLDIAAPLSIGGKRWGIFLCRMSLERARAMVNRVLSQIAMVAAAAIIAAFILIYFLSRRFIQPITELARMMEEVDLEERIPVARITGGDELARLGSSFNAMTLRLKEANLEMKQAHERMLESEKLATLGTLAASVAHRINNPLGGIQNCLELIEKEETNKKSRSQYLALIREGLQSIEETVGQLLWTAGRGRGEESRCEAAEVLSGVLRFLDHRLRKAGISLNQYIEQGLVLPVAPHDLNEILMNTMVNAIQAMPDGGNLEVSAGEEGPVVFLTIRDTGSGIAKDDLQKIMTPFFSTKKSGEGTGIGLWMTYELVKKYRGEIEIDSSPGLGTTVNITFDKNIKQ